MPSVDRYAVIGHPVSHSRSPFIHGKFAEATAQALVYDRIDATPEDFVGVVRAFFQEGGKGLNVTVPHKEAAATLSDELSERARQAGAVNTLIALPGGRIRGDNTDGVGLVTDLESNLGVTLEGRRILLIGAGGAARGVMAPLLARAPSALVVVNRTASRAEALAAHFACLGAVTGGGSTLLDREASFDVVINASSAGLAGTVMELPRHVVGPTSIGYDMVYRTGATPFMQQLIDMGAARVWSGFGMLVEQAAESFYLWRGIRPPTAGVLAQLC